MLTVIRSLETARAREVWRPKVLRMEIPHVHRVTSYAWYHRRKEEMERLKQVLEEALGIMLIRKVYSIWFRRIKEHEWP